MAESLAQSDVQRRHIIADIAHEPHAVDGYPRNLEALMDGVYELTRERGVRSSPDNGVSAGSRPARSALAEAGQLCWNANLFHCGK